MMIEAYISSFNATAGSTRAADQAGSNAAMRQRELAVE